MAAAEIDEWLRSGGFVVTASERAARAMAAAYHRARRAEGLAAWPAPEIYPWSDFIRNAWQRRAFDGRLLLNSAQEESLWAEIVAFQAQAEIPLEGPRHRVARLAMEAHALLCAYAPQLLESRARTAWQQDATDFSKWLASFDQICRSGNFISSARLPIELLTILEAPSADADRFARPPVLLFGFDRIQPTQRRLFDAWGSWREVAPASPTGAQGPNFGTRDGLPFSAVYYETRDAQSEFAACAIWCKHQLAVNPQARLLVVSQEAAARRGEIERAFLRHLGSDSLFEFTLGVPINQVPLAHSAHLILRWLAGSLAEHEIDWLFSSGYAAGPQESSALQNAMRTIRRRNLEQPDWPLANFISQIRVGQSQSAPILSWTDRITQARQRLADVSRQPRTPLEWAEFASQTLESIAWPTAAGPPAARVLSSAEFQAARRFHQAVETAGSLGFDGRRISWQDFLSSLARVLDQTLFAPESRNAPVQIAGPAESAGLSADAIWFLGVNEDAWPAAAPTHPLLPAQVQRQFEMPHATPQLDWDLARSITTRLLVSAPEVHFSFAGHAEGIEMRASRLVEQFVGPAQPLPEELASPPIADPLTIEFEDASQIPFPPGKVEGGAAVLTFQSQCPFKAFAGFRLGAEAWGPAQPSLTPAQRGKLLHAVLHAIWAGPPDGLHNLQDLQNLQDRASFVAGHLRRVFQREIRTDLRTRMPRAYLELEEQRLVRLISEWLNYESTRADFEVLKTEDKRTIHLAGLTFDLRLDRIDRLNDGTLLVIDYKTGRVSPSSWNLPRPDDVQLPLYAGFALDRAAEPIGGLAFARVRPGDICFAGRIGDTQGTLSSTLTGYDTLVREPLTAEMLIDWRVCIELLARNFLNGRADVAPRDFPDTCKNCGLHTLCRIHENSIDFDSGGNDANTERAEAADE